MSEWPEHSEELARKSMETLQANAHLYETGKLSSKEFRMVINTILDVTQGLMPHDVFDVIYAVRKELDATCPP